MKSDRRSQKALFALLRANAGTFAGAMLSTAVVVTLGLLPPLLLAEVIDCLLGGQPSTMPAFLLDALRSVGLTRAFFTEHLWAAGLILVLVYLVNGVFTYLKGRLAATASENVACSLRDRLYAHLQRLPFAWHVHAQTGDLIQRCTSDVETVRRFLAVQMTEAVSTVMMLVIAISVMLSRSVRLTLFSMMLIPGLLWFAAWFYKHMSDAFRISDEAEGRMSAVLLENLSGVRVVRAFGQQQREVERFDTVSRDFKKKTDRLYDLLAIYWGGGDAITLLQQGISLIVCVLAAIRGEITVGTLIVITSYLGQLIFPVRQLGRTLGDAGKSKVAMERMLAILDEPAEPDEPDAVKPPLDGDIVFDHVSFAYPDDSVPVLHDISCTIPAGSTVAVLGATGSGKSTMMYLLQRLYEPTSGRITIGGVDIRTVDRTWLRSHVGLILQEPFLYSKTIRENVGIARRAATPDAVEHAVEIAGATGFIHKADKGYETLVGEKGVTLSGGQKQRIAIARTLLKDNTILVFDDSLSAVDTETDMHIRAALRHEAARLTTLIISHRITTLSQADCVLVLEKGRITQQGTPDELLRQDGLYSRIHAIQAGLAEEEEVTR